MIQGKLVIINTQDIVFVQQPIYAVGSNPKLMFLNESDNVWSMCTLCKVDLPGTRYQVQSTKTWGKRR